MSVVRQQTSGRFNFELVVVDDSSTDNTPAVVEGVRAQSPVSVRYLRHSGHPGTRNWGVEQARGAWIAFFDDDQVAEPDWLKELYDGANATGAAIIGGARRLRFVEPGAPACGPTTRSILGEKEHGPRRCPCDRVSLAVTGNVLIRRDVLATIGGFSTAMPCGMSDIDFSRRALERGIPSWYTPTAVVHHLIPGYRLTTDYLRWTSRRVGLSLALINRCYAGRTDMLWRSLLRLGHAAVLGPPIMAWAKWREDAAEFRDRQCYWWMAEGGGRMALKLLFPRWFPQDKFFQRLEFRRERKMFARDTGG